MKLSPAERDVLRLIANGMSRREVARIRRRRLGTVKAQLATIYLKLGATNRAHAVAIAIAWGILKPTKGGVK